MTGKELRIFAAVSACNAKVAAMQARNLAATSPEYVPYDSDAFFSEADALEKLAADAEEL